MNTFQEFVSEEAVRGLTRLTIKDFNNLGKLATVLSKFAKEENHKQNFAAVLPHLSDPKSNWYQLLNRVTTTTDPQIVETMLVNFLIKASLKGIPIQHETAAKIGASVPFALLIDPTSACNLSCTGCWAGKYKKSDNLSYELLDRILTEAEEIGIYFIVFSGGEPLVRKKDIIALAEAHPKMAFHLFTNGTLIDQEFVADLKRVANVTMAISVEGFENRTDERRGKGVFQQITNAMDLLHANGVPFGFSATYTHLNTAEVGSEEFIDFMIERGAAWGWYFTYIPVGKDPDLSYMATTEQRQYMYKQINHFRGTKPIFLVDFWNDGAYSDGCIAGGRRYLHINASGEVEPCAFIHYSNCNIKDVSLSEALQSPLFKAYQKRQPFNSNLLCPCPLLDNPHVLPEIVAESGAVSTQNSEDDPVKLAKLLEQYSQEWEEVSGEIWHRDFPELAAKKEEQRLKANAR